VSGDIWDCRGRSNCPPDVRVPEDGCSDQISAELVEWNLSWMPPRADLVVCCSHRRLTAAIRECCVCCCCWTVSSTELDSINDDLMENDEDVDSDEDSSVVLKTCDSHQGTLAKCCGFLL